MSTWIWLALAACSGGDTYIVEGTVVEVHPPSEVVIDHADIPKLMGAMVMPFDVADPALLEGLEPGHRVVGRLRVEEAGSELVKLRIVGKGAAPVAVDEGPMPVWAGAQFPETPLVTHTGQSLVLGPSLNNRVALTFLYTRCPLPEACPAIVSRLQALQPVLPDGTHIVAVSLDPEHDTVEVLAAFAEQVGADARWSFARVDPERLPDLAMHAGMNVMEEGDLIVHSIRMLILDEGGRVIERYDDTRWPLERVVEQLATGGPRPPPGSSGTSTPTE